MASSNQWSIGFAQDEITPRKAIHMSGYGRERYGQGVIAPLIAQAVALRDARGVTGVVIAADVLGFEHVTLHILRARIGKKHAIAPDNILLAPSHTHWGPATLYRFNYGGGGPSFWYLKWLEEKLLELVDLAMADLTPASLEYFNASARVGHSRRLFEPESHQVKWIPNPQGHYDTHTPVLKITRPGHARVRQVLIVSHACHPTSSGLVDKWTPDYPGAMRDALAGALGPGTGVVFAMGPGADAKVTHTDPANGGLAFTASPEGAKEAGESLARQVLEQMALHPGQAVAPGLKCASATVDLALTRWKTAQQMREMVAQEGAPVWDAAFARQALELPDLRTQYPYQVTAWKLGQDLTLFGMPDEVCSPWGPRARSFARTGHAMVAAYINHVQCYIPDEQIRFEGGYEGDSSHRAYFMPGPFAQGVQEKVDDALKRVVDALG